MKYEVRQKDATYSLCVYFKHFMQRICKKLEIKLFRRLRLPSQRMKMYSVILWEGEIVEISEEKFLKIFGRKIDEVRTE
jgi:hypothetical protein